MTSCSGKKVLHKFLLPTLFCKACDLVPTLASKKGGGEEKDRYKRRRGLQAPHFLWSRRKGGGLFGHASLTPADECGRWEEGTKNGLEPTLSGKARCWRDGA